MRYKMLIKTQRVEWLTSIRSFEAKNDQQALEVFRRSGNNLELRAERQNEYPLGRLIAYRDTAGNEQLKGEKNESL